jgi:putative nucleotidyltransferase with HDIG domain
MSTIEQKSLAISELLRQTVAALSSAMLHRDPTTANHQKNVAKLSVAIGKILGLDAQRLEGLQLAALVHDIGQIQIPAEIMARARKLSNEEFELIKMHSEAGYAILYDIPFPWPIAEIVYQHHENLDGSGYPRQLTNDEIMLEAKIIRVADSMEAMLSHRPFRRAYDKEFAFVELHKFSGKYYDPDVLDACFRLFKEHNFSFSE